MDIEVRKESEEVIIEVGGRVDTTTAPKLEKTIIENINNTKSLILDLKELKYISSAGLRVLLNAQKKMKNIGSMKVKNVHEEIMEIFEMTGFADILTIE